MSKAFKDAIERGRAIAKEKWRDSFADFDRRFGISAVYCRLCGQVIARVMPVGVQQIRRLGKQTFIQDRMAFGYLPNYREALMEMDDGSKHVANLCVDCASTLDVSNMEALYAMDLAQWSSEGSVLSDSTCNRRPTRLVKVADYIRE